jgi:hypothetical protein
MGGRGHDIHENPEKTANRKWEKKIK